MRFEAEAAHERIQPAGALPDPKLQVELRDLTRMGEQNATLNPSRVGSTRYLLMQDLPWFGKRELRSSVVTAEAQAATGLARGNWTELSALIKQTYIQRYFLSRNERLTREVLDLMRRLEQIAQSRYANGLAVQQDVIRAQVEQTAMRNDLLMLDNESRALTARLNALLTRDPNTALAEPLSLPAAPLPARMQFADLIERLRNNNPQIQVEGARMQAAEHKRELTYKDRYPDFTIGVAPIQTRNSVREWELMLQMNIPLQQGTRRSQEREANAMLAAARSRHEAAGNRLVGELATSLAAYDTGVRTESLLSTSLLPQAEVSLHAAMAGYENGKLDFATLLDAQRQITQTRISLLKAQAEQHLRLIEIEKMLGDAP
jgi:outer membrane protein TolC